jgi:hypothetical protein
MKKDKVTLYLDTDDIETLNRVAEAEDTSPSRIVRILIREHLASKKSLIKRLLKRDSQ